MGGAADAKHIASTLLACAVSGANLNRRLTRRGSAHGLCLYRALQFHRAREGAGLERLVQRAEDRADAGEAAFSHLSALCADCGPRAELSSALDAAIADAFKSEQYTTDWGFFEWAPFITDWSRDLFHGGDTPESSFAVSASGALEVVSFDGSAPDEAERARAAMANSRPGMMWLPVAGLDRHTLAIGLRVLGDAAATEPFAAGDPRVQQAIYRPISDFTTAAG